MTRTANAFKMAGVVLAGGNSRRMGRDKALLDINGETLLDKACTLLEATGCKLVCISGRPGHPAGISDSYPGGGPGQAILDALEMARRTGQDGLLVIPVDMPGLTIATLQPLLQPTAARCQGWKNHPLPVFIRPTGPMPDRTEAASVRSLLAALGTTWLATRPDQANQFRNINSPEDLESFQDLA